MKIYRQLAAGTLAAVLFAGPLALSGVPMSPDRLMVVDCLLPSQVRKVGGSITYLTARHAIKTVASECEIRGGEYVAYDRANFSTSLQVWLPQAQGGDPQAAVYVGEIYEKGLGTASDYTQAAFWYQKAADKGFARGLSDLAYLYEQGLGVPKDPVKALNLYRRSAGISGDDLTFTSEVTAAKEEAASQINALARQLDASNEQAGALREELEKAQDEAQAKGAALRAAQAEARTVRKRLEELKAQGSASTADRAELRRLQDALAASEDKVADAQREAQAIQASNEAKAAELNERLQKAAAEDQQLRAQLGSHVVDAQQTRADLAAAQARIDSMNRQIAELRQQLDIERAAVAEEQAKIGQRSAAHDAALNDELNRLRQALADREARFAQQQALLAAVQTERGSAEAEVERLKTRESELQKEQSQQHLDSDTLRAQIASLQQRLLQSQQQLLAANATADGEKTRIDAEREQLTRAQASSAASQQAEIKNLSARLADREAKLLEQQTHMAALEAQGRAYQDEIAALQTVRTRGVTSDVAETMIDHPPAIAPKDLNLGAFHALIIGNDDYQFMPKLESAVSDARAVERVLREHYGFKTQMLLNAGRAEILSALNDYRQSLGERDSFLIYYAGHGELNERSLLGYWLPVNAKRNDTTEWISDRMITDQIGLMPARHIMVIADSCYSGAMTRSSSMHLVARTTGQSGAVKRLTKLALLPSRTVLTSGGEEPVLDGGAGANSIFARALIDVLSNNHAVLEGSALYDQLFGPVRNAAARFKVDQSPRYSALADAGHLNGEFLLIPVG
jgi:caspase domain-containing protein/Sel1 repeat-containing protein